MTYVLKEFCTEVAVSSHFWGLRLALCYLLFYTVCKGNKMFSFGQIFCSMQTQNAPKPKKVFQQQQNRKTLSFRFYQMKIWWKSNDILRSWASTEHHLFCTFCCIYLHLHRPGRVVVTDSTSTLSFRLLAIVHRIFPQDITIVQSYGNSVMQIGRKSANQRVEWNHREKSQWGNTTGEARR